MPHKFIEVPTGEHGTWYWVYQDGKHLQISICVPMNGKRFLKMNSQNTPRLPRCERKRIWKDFNKFLENKHMGIKNPYFNTDVLHG